MVQSIQTFPVAGYTLRSVAAYDALLLRFDYLSHPMQSPDEAHPGRDYMMTRAQAIELRDALSRAIEKMQQAPIPPELRQ